MEHYHHIWNWGLRENETIEEDLPGGCVSPALQLEASPALSDYGVEGLESPKDLHRRTSHSSASSNAKDLDSLCDSLDSVDKHYTEDNSTALHLHRVSSSVASSPVGRCEVSPSQAEEIAESDKEESPEAENSIDSEDASQEDELYPVAAKTFDSITISDDLSLVEKVEERRFLALRDRNTPSSAIRSHTGHSTHALQDYQMKLMLLEQQNKRRLMLAREMASAPLLVAEGDSSRHGVSSSSNRQPPTLKRPLSDIMAEDEDLDPGVLDLDALELQSFIGRLQDRAQRLGGTKPGSGLNYTHQVLYRILEHQSVHESKKGTLKATLSPPFLDPPIWVAGQDRGGKLRCELPVGNFDLYLEKNKNISFLVYKTYSVSYDQVSITNPLGQSHSAADVPTVMVDESIKPVTSDLTMAIDSVLRSKEEYAETLQAYKGTSELHAPFLFVFHHRNEWTSIRDSLPPSSQEQMTLFWNYIGHKMGDEYAAADRYISEGKISADYIKYLFKPGDVVVQRKSEAHLGWVVRSWPQMSNTYETTKRNAVARMTRGTMAPLYNSTDATAHQGNEKVIVQTWGFKVWHWQFDGNFQRTDDHLSLSIVVGGAIERAATQQRPELAQNSDNQDVVAINELETFPLRYASSDVVAQLRQRGQIFWKCRNRALVSYHETENDLTDERYMIDFKTYRTLHKDSSMTNMVYNRAATGLKDELGPDVLARDEPPDPQFELLLPATIKGYNLRKKKWYDLAAGRIKDVQWNKEAFEKVVIDRKVKDLIRALVSNQLASEASTDLIEGKGNGLILLLHGSPGTGKTLTAESVAEIAEKPLYRVTCGDVGTKAEDVEKYLESVLYLGKLWGCVVLLDEADVFLEQRSLEDLQRNALVSVFLRILEYYEGILVLTSNRVGTFDEAFKSRIQLALHYPTLGPYQRLRIWENFLDRLEKIDDQSVDLADLRDHLNELKDEEMNGRQIRNAITTARQYAKWKEATMTYAHLKDVIEVSGRFDKYLNKLHGGLSEDQVAEDEGLR